MKDETRITRKRMIELLNEDLSREYQAIIAYVIYSQTLKGAEYNHIAQELEKHAAQELSHALKIAKQIEESKSVGQTARHDKVRSRKRAADVDQLSPANSSGRRDGRVRARRGFARNHRPGTGTFAGPGRRAWNRYTKDRIAIRMFDV